MQWSYCRNIVAVALTNFANTIDFSADEYLNERQSEIAKKKKKKNKEDLSV